MVTLALSNILGLIRDHYLAQKIPTDKLDIYYAAFRLPDLIFNVLILGAIAAAFIPVFTSIRQRQEKEAWEIAASAINLGILAVAFLGLIIFILMPVLVPLYVPKFSPEKQLATLNLSRFMLLSPLIFTLSYFLGGILNSFKRFLIYSLAPLIYNLTIIIFTLIFADKLSFWAPGIGVVGGAFFHMLVQLPPAWGLGFRPSLGINFALEGLKKIYKLMVPRSIGLGGQQLMLLAFTALASRFPGQIAIYNLADNIQTVPSVIFGAGLATAIFPTLSQYSGDKEKEKFSYYLTRAMRMILFLTIPAVVGLVVLRAQVIRLILGSGYFGWTETVIAIETLTFFGLGILASSLIPLLARSFYALHNTLTPMVIALISIAVSIISAWLLVGKMEVVGLALAFSIGSWVQVILLYLILRRKVEIKFEEGLVNAFARVVLLSLGMAVVIQSLKEWMARMVDIDRVIGLLSQAVVAGGVGALLYLFLAWFFRYPELGRLDGPKKA